MKKSFSIRAYLGFSYALLLALSLGAVGIIWSRNEYRVITQELQKLMRERVSLLADIISHEVVEYGELEFEAWEIPIVHQEKALLAVYIDKTGTLYELVPDSVNAYQEELFLSLSDKYQITDDNFATMVASRSEITNVYAAAPVYDAQNKPIGKVCLLMPLGDLGTYISRLRLLLLLAIGIVGLLSLGVAAVLTNYFSRHFSQAQELAATVASGDYHLRIPEMGPTELRNLSHYLNEMAEKLQQQSKMRQTLLANVTHELARPLAGLQLGIESLRKGAIHDPDLADDLLVSMEQTIRNFDNLINDISLAEQPETHSIQLQFAALPVKPFVKGIVARFWSQAKLRDIRFEVHIADDTPPIFADEKRLNQIIGNLVDNAIKFTPDGKVIRLCAKPYDEDSVCLMVHDGGRGISAEETEHIFQPFFQGDRGRQIKQGMGLGLAIAHQLALAHGGSLSLENHPEGGALASLILPAADA